MPIQDVFDTAYWAAQPDEVRALRELPQGTDRAARAMSLAVKGFNIDVPIDVYGWDAYLVMFERVSSGYTWVPSALQAPVQIAPGLGSPGRVAYDPNHAPANSIKVSILPADYTAFPGVPHGLTNPYLIGMQIAPGMPLYYAFDAEPDGFKVTDAGSATHPAGDYQRHRQIVAITPFGAEANNWYQLLTDPDPEPDRI